MIVSESSCDGTIWVRLNTASSISEHDLAGRQWNDVSVVAGWQYPLASFNPDPMECSHVLDRMWGIASGEPRYLSSCYPNLFALVAIPAHAERHGSLPLGPGLTAGLKGPACPPPAPQQRDNTMTPTAKDAN